jgi:hypothetical protein
VSLRHESGRPWFNASLIAFFPKFLCWDAVFGSCLTSIPKKIRNNKGTINQVWMLLAKGELIYRIDGFCVAVWGRKIWVLLIIQMA